MKIEKDFNLSKLSRLRIGGIAKNLYYLETQNDIISIIKSVEQSQLRFISNGSNILINNKSIFEHVISFKKYRDDIEDFGNGTYKVYAGTKLQKLINKIHEKNYGGIENLYSVPGLVCASVAMNAGTGKDKGNYIGNYVKEATVIVDSQIKKFTNVECQFGFRDSVFKQKNIIILDVIFNFPKMLKEEIEEELKWKKNIVDKYQDIKAKTLGSTFSVYNEKLMRFIRKSSRIIFFWFGIKYSKKSINWIHNVNYGTYLQAKILINYTIFIHKLFRKDIKLEIKIWE
jgi:UDP-N-acetylmuramate dehydrogenase